MTTNNSYQKLKDCKLKDFIQPRLPPYLWDIVGYGGGLTLIFLNDFHNNSAYLAYSSVFVLYGLLNIAFDYLTVSFEYSNESMPEYKNIGKYNFYITNKKYKLQIKKEPNVNGNNLDEVLQCKILNESKLKFELSVYLGENNVIKKLLFYTYLFGITKKNFVTNHLTYFIEDEFTFV